MKKMLLMVLALFVSQAQAKEYLVKYKSQTLVQNLQRITMNEMSPMVMLDHNSKAKLIKVSVNGKKEAQVLAHLLSNSEVEYGATLN